MTQTEIRSAFQTARQEQMQRIKPLSLEVVKKNRSMTAEGNTVLHTELASTDEAALEALVNRHY